MTLHKLTQERYLAIERDADFESEYCDGEIYVLAGGSSRHSELAAVLI